VTEPIGPLSARQVSGSVADVVGPQGVPASVRWWLAAPVLLALLALSALSFDTVLHRLLACAFLGSWLCLPPAALLRLCQQPSSPRVWQQCSAIALTVLSLPWVAFVADPASSSTSSLLFIFLPLWQLVAIAVMWLGRRIFTSSEQRRTDGSQK
jgi:hypothetical protein